MAKKPAMLHQGKVRDTYPGNEPNELVVVASDRISVSDVVLPQLIPGKGIVLTHMTKHWLTATPVGQVMPHHLLTSREQSSPLWLDDQERYRTMVVRKLDMLKVEAVIRGYLAGSGWKDYCNTGLVSGIELPSGMQEMEKFPNPIFTPATKAEEGHDENIDFEGMVLILGDRGLAERVRSKAIKLYQAGAAYALERGIILVDTKFEFGINPETGGLTLGDEVLTPDSSRYVAAETYEVGKPPASMDKQIVRDYYDSIGWDRTDPAPDMPQWLIDQTVEVYGDIAERLTGTNPLI